MCYAEIVLGIISDVLAYEFIMEKQLLRVFTSCDHCGPNMILERGNSGVVLINDGAVIQDCGDRFENLFLRSIPLSF